ncbi:carbohydrate kinase [Chungangia koreensis]|uniref:Carbohydrate kinase n=1 Tax=Chungangia koreensis TaxID=752657 RepID=A0ABV8X424_9LACT
MSIKDQAIIDLIKQFPFLSQQEMAEKLNMSRPALANAISRLIREGKIIGRAYILPEENEIICIGGANVDRKFHLKNVMKQGTSNPAEVSQSVGGVARNVAENLGRLGHKVRLITAAGQDSEWTFIEQESLPFMNLQSVEFTSVSTGSYTAVIEPTGEMSVALAVMDVYEYLTPAVLSKSESFLRNASMLLTDLNCPKDTIDYLRKIALESDVELTVVAVSSPKMDRLPDNLLGVNWLICNVDEAEAYLNVDIQDQKTWEAAAQELCNRGVTNAIVTWGSKGVVACTRDKSTLHFSAEKLNHMSDATGAGDAFVGGLIHGRITGWPLEMSIQAGQTNAFQTLQSSHTVRKELTANSLRNEMEA